VRLPTIGAIVIPPASPALPAAGRRARAPAPAGSPLVRASLAVYVVLLVYGSLSPWSGWRALGVNPFAFIGAPWPAYVTGFDLALNVLAYLPLGLLAALGLHPRWRGWPAVLIATTLAAAVSVLIEALQNYLPARIPSNVDVLTNVAGAALGAAAGMSLAPGLIDGGRLQQARQRWLRPRSAGLLLLAALWPLAQIHPGQMLFGNGELDRQLVSTLLVRFDLALPAFDAGRFAAAEALVTACGMLAAGAALGAATKPDAPRLRLLMLLLGAALAAKAVSYGHAFGPERAFAWLTPGAVAGLAVGWLALTAAAAMAGARAAAALAVAALLLLLAAVNLVPPNPYHAQWVAAWQPGRLRDVAAASEWLAQAWPFALLAVLLWPLGRRSRPPQPDRGR